MNCRHCAASLTLCIADLGTCPPSNSYLDPKDISAPEKWYPLKVFVCEECWLVQTADFVDREECFSTNYAYFSSCSTSWLEHAFQYSQEIIRKRDLGADSLVVEVAANDGYLLQYFAKSGISCYGIEPTESTASVARAQGLEIVPEFFGSSIAKRLVRQRGAVDLLVANNVLAHVPDINDFVKGVSIMLKPNGVATFEFPHLLHLLTQNLFDTIYHEHFSYLSLHVVEAVMENAALSVIDVEELRTHGGSLRVTVAPRSAGLLKSQKVIDIIDCEKSSGVLSSDIYRKFSHGIETVRNNFIRYLIDLKESGTTVAAYGAAAKGNTILNYTGVKQDLLPYVVDRSPGKIGKFMPGSRIPIYNENILREKKPEIILILPWNLRDEVSSQLSYTRKWGAKFAVALPKIEVF